jgi:hypothetical protein
MYFSSVIPQDPATCSSDSFPTFNDPIYWNHLKKRVKRWARFLRLGKQLQTELARYDDPKKTLGVPTKRGSIPVFWWQPEDDKNLILGVGKYGLGHFNEIRNDPEFGFVQKVELFTKKMEEKAVRHRRFSSPFLTVPESSHTLSLLVMSLKMSANHASK